MRKVFKTIVLLLILIVAYLIFYKIKEKNKNVEAVFLGVENYGNLTKADDSDNILLSNFKYNFYIDGKKVSLALDNGKEQEKGFYEFNLQNKLQEGYIYNLKIENGIVKDIEILDKESDRVVLGKIKEIRDKKVILDDGKEIPFSKNTNFYKILWKVGESSVEKINLDDLKEQNVKIVLDKDKNTKNIYVTFLPEEYIAPVKPIPGKKTLKNFLVTALSPVGTTLYIYGGAWDWQDEGSSCQATSIGIPRAWVEFYQYQNTNYTYRDKDGNEENKKADESYYPYGKWNQYYYAGADCSGYVGWVIYNTLNDENGKDGYVMGATKMAKTFAENGWGEWTQEYKIPKDNKTTDFKIGDIFSMNGHVWICFGTCDDGSILITHSTPNKSITGQPGGGIQISAMGVNKNCEAYKLAEKYMKKYYSDWTSRYEVILKTPEDYTKINKESKAGKFSWNLENGILSDPDNYRGKKPSEILKDIFNEK